jgi:hypothetical protein
MYKIKIPINLFEWLELPTDNESLAKGLNNYWNISVSESLKFVRNNFQNAYIKTLMLCVEEVMCVPLSELVNTYVPMFKDIDLSLLNHEILYTSIFSNMLEKKFSELKNNIQNYVDKL